MPLYLLGALTQPPVLLVDPLPRVAPLTRLVHALVVSGHPALGALDDEEVLDPAGVLSLPEALLLHLLGRRVCKPVAILLAHHGDGPVAAAEAVRSGFLTVAEEAVELRLDGHGELAKALIQVLLIGLGLPAEEARSKTTLVCGMVAVDRGEGHVAQLMLLVGLRAGDHEGPLLVVGRQDVNTAGCQLCDLMVCLVRHAQNPGFIDGLRRSLGPGDAVGGETLARAEGVVGLVRRGAGNAADIIVYVVPGERVFV